MKHMKWMGIIVTCPVVISLSLWVVAGQSPNNGEYGGYLGSNAWFASMRQSAANRAMLQSLGSRSGGRAAELPPDYIEAAGRIVFPKGNPFPDKRLPDLRIMCHNREADSVERAPFIDRQGGFYVVLKRGQHYDFSWMYYFGSKEKFLTLNVRTDQPRQSKYVIEYSPHGSRAYPVITFTGNGTVDTSPETLPDTLPPVMNPHQAGDTPTERGPSRVPLDTGRYDLSGFPRQPTNFEEQQVMEAIHTATTSGLKAFAHSKLAKYYQGKGDDRRARVESAKADYWRNRP